MAQQGGLVSLLIPSAFSNNHRIAPSKFTKDISAVLNGAIPWLVKVLDFVEGAGASIFRPQDRYFDCPAQVLCTR